MQQTVVKNPNNDADNLKDSATVVAPDDPPRPDMGQLTEGENQPIDASYEVRDGYLYKMVSGKMDRVANFFMIIVSQHKWIDESRIVSRHFQIELHLDGKIIPLAITAEDFTTRRLMDRIVEQAGSSAIIYGSLNDLRIAAQEMSSAPVKTVTTSMGFDEQGNYLAPGMRILKSGFELPPQIQVDLSRGNFAKRLCLMFPDQNQLKPLLEHLHNDFLKLKEPQVMYPLMGHIILAALSSQIQRAGKQKPAMHLQGPSGSGKTFLGNLASSFYGTFDDRPIAWTSTANAIESEGFLFRDALMFIDDFKTAIVNPQKVIRIIQNAADSQGRARLLPGWNNHTNTAMRSIRGMILSTGEDFITNQESITGRTLLLRVETDQNVTAGRNCWARREQYQMIIPAILQWLLAQDDWFPTFIERVEQRSDLLRAAVGGLSNGMRIANNWALNGVGFQFFIQFSKHTGAIDDRQTQEILDEYDQIISQHIASHADRLMLQDPVEMSFQALGQKFAAGTVRIDGWSNQRAGQTIGKLRDNGQIVCLFPDLTMQAIRHHFSLLGYRPNFTKETLRDALVRQNLLILSGNGRITHQVRMAGNRLQAWQFDINEFKARCGMID